MALRVGQYVLRWRLTGIKGSQRLPDAGSDQIRYTIVNRMIQTRSTKCQYRPTNSIGL